MNFFKKQSLKYLFSAILLLVMANILGNYFFLRFDLTKEKKYTLTKPTKKLLKKLPQNIDIEIYLTGNNLPAGIKKLQQQTKEILEEFRRYSNGKITYHFFDINSIKDAKQKEEFQNNLVKKGLKPINLEVKSNDGYSENIVFAGAILKTNNREIPIQILENQFSFGSQGAIDNSLNFLEYKLANSVQKISKNRTPKIAFLQGHGELDYLPLKGFVEALATQNFAINTIDLSKESLQKNEIDILIIAKPNTAILENEKFLIDQFIMNGGKTIWLIDNVIADLDSFKISPSIFSVPRNLNIDDVLFRYGVRINHDMILDLYCNEIPMIENIGGNPQPKLFPWVFYPVSVSKNNHSIVKNIDPVMFKFANSIDILNNPDVNKTVLLSTSDYSRTQISPFQIFLEGAKQKPNPYFFNKKNIPLAVLLEGNFSSFYKNQFTDDFQKLAQNQQINFKPKSDKNKMIVIADGDIASNDIDANNVTLPLGYYKYNRKNFANKDFLLNCVEYLVDDNGLIEARNKEIKMRLLDKAKVIDQKTLWQIINLLFPLSITFIFGFIFNKRRQKKYAN